MTMTPTQCLAEIRKRTRDYPELQNAHHFLFDLPVGLPLAGCDVGKVWAQMWGC